MIDELPDEVVVFDRARNQAHCLNRIAACVWRHCDGRNSVPAIAAQVQRELKVAIDEQIVWIALKRLDKARLLCRPITWPDLDRSARRDALRRMAAAAIAAPLVMTVLAPTAAQAASSIDTCYGQNSCGNRLCPQGQNCNKSQGLGFCTCN
ncbi:MAG: PqqD family protein [Gemmataceae bacterium]